MRFIQVDVGGAVRKIPSYHVFRRRRTTIPHSASGLGHPVFRLCDRMDANMRNVLDICERHLILELFI